MGGAAGLPLALMPARLLVVAAPASVSPRSRAWRKHCRGLCRF